MQYLIFDAAIVLLLALAVWRGYRKGFILTFCGFLAIFVALIGATVVSNVLAQPVSQAISPMIESSIQQAVAEKLQSPDPLGQENASQLPDSSGSQDPSQESPASDLPLQEILDLLEQSPVYRGFAGELQSAVDAGLVSATANATIVISEYIAGQVARMVLFVVSFVLILILWFFVSHALDLAFKLPVLSSLNRLGGGALGLLKGALLIYVACWLLKGSFLPQEAIQNTYLLHFFCTASPLTLLS